MARHSWTVFEEIVSHAQDCAEDSGRGLYELAKVRLAKIQALVGEAESRLRKESKKSQAAQQQATLPREENNEKQEDNH